MKMIYDLVILGGGPAGYLAAIRAAQLGATVALVEKGEFGGVCLNRGCIPTKALLRTVEMAVLGRKGKEFGVMEQAPVVLWPAAHSRKERVMKSLRLGIEHLLKNDSIGIFRGNGSVVDSQKVRVEMPEETIVLHGKKLLIATGSLPKRPPIPGIELAMTSDEILSLHEAPISLAIIGGGAIGLEFAQMFSALNTKVTIIEMTEQLLPQEDAEIAAEVQKLLKRQGIQIQLAAKVSEMKAAENGIELKITHGDKETALEVSHVLLAAGRKPAVPQEIISLGAAVGSNGELMIDEAFSTNIPGIYAAGDVTGGQLLAHKAYAEGKAAVENMLGFATRLERDTIPACVYIQPELATVGMKEVEALAAGYEVRTGRFLFRNNGRALALGERDGMVKVITDKNTQVILGAQIIGAQATELISELTLAVSLGLKAEVLADLVHPHPTLSEAVMEACADAIGRAIHK